MGWSVRVAGEVDADCNEVDAMKETRLMQPNTVGELHGHVHYERLSCASEPACAPVDPFQDALPCWDHKSATALRDSIMAG